MNDTPPETSHTRFMGNMLDWLMENGFTVGIPKQDFEEDLSIELQRKWAHLVSDFFDLSILGKIAVSGTSASADQVATVIKPVLNQAHLVGYKLSLIVQMIPVLVGDSLSRPEIENRLKSYLKTAKELRKLGHRVMLLRKQVLVSPLIFFFEKDAYLRRAKSLIPVISQMQYFQQAYLLGALINVPDRQVYYPKSSLFRISSDETKPAEKNRLAHNLGRRLGNIGGLVMFDNLDLRRLLNE